MYYTVVFSIMERSIARGMVYHDHVPPYDLGAGIRADSMADVVRLATTEANMIVKKTGAQIVSLSHSSSDRSVVVLFKEAQP